MAVIYNDKVCVSAREIIRYDEKYKVGCESGFMSKSNFDWMKKQNQIIIARRSTPGHSALVEFDTMRPDMKKKYIEVYGDPYAELASRDQKSDLEEEIRYNNSAYSFFRLMCMAKTIACRRLRSTNIRCR